MADLGSGTSLPTSPPANPGDTFFDENVAIEKVWNGSAWVPLGGGGTLGSEDVTILNVPLPITTDGSAATGVAQDAGGTGAIGWLSSAVKNLRLLAGTITGTSLKVIAQAGANIIGKVGIDQTTPGTTNGVQVNAALPAGTNIIGKFGIDQTTAGVTNGVQLTAALPAGGNTIGAVGLVAGAAIIGDVGIDQSVPGTTNAVQVTTASPGGAVGNPAYTVAKSATAALTSVASSATSVALLTSNAARRGFMVYNESTANLKLAYANAASATGYTVLIIPSGYYEVLTTVYTGAISGIWDSAQGSARITELT
jgi:hypothetical protein